MTDRENNMVVSSGANVTETSNQMLSIIAAASKDPAVSVEKMSGLLDLQRELMKDQAIQAFEADFEPLAKTMPRVPKHGMIELGKDNSGKSKGSIPFARWEDMDKLIRPLLQEHGFSLSFDTEDKQGGGFWVIGILTHRSGHSKRARFPVVIDSSGAKNNIQGAGSSLSYGKRYTTEMLLNIVREGEDDDGKRGGMEFISQEQGDEVLRLITETKSDEVKFLQTFKVATVFNLTLEEYPRALNMLHAKKQKMEKTERPPV